MASIYDKASLVLIPSGTKTSKVYSQKPVSGDGDFTFSRSTAATRVGPDGLIEKETQNLLLQSNNFDTTWGNSNSTETSGQSGYDGSNDAWRIDKTASGGYLVQNIGTSGVQTFSVYAKAGSTDWMQLLTLGSGTGSRYVFYDLTNGVIGSQSGSGTYGIDSNIESVGGGWYRCSLTFNTTLNDVRIYPAEANSVSAASGNIYIQDAQLEQGLVARDYIETTTSAVEGGITDNVPRLDYTDSSCPALLLEPQRTNLVTHSEYFGDSSWSEFPFGGGSLTKTFGYTGPEGVDNAYKLDVIVGTGGILFTHNFTATASVDHTLSVWMKGEVGGEKVQIEFKNTSSSGIAGSLLTLTNEWKRYDLTFTNDTGTSRGFQFRMQQSSGVSDQTIYVYGAQAEEGSYATSYIPTYGTSVTRNQDASLVTSVSSLIGQPNGSIFLDFVYDNNTSNTRIFSVTGGNWFTNGSIRLEKVGNLFRWNWLKEGVGGASLDSTTTMVKGTRYKMAITYTDSVCSLFINGAKEDTSACDTPTNLSGIYLNELGGGYSDGWEFQRNIFNQVLMFNTTLTDQEAIDLTTL